MPAAGQKRILVKSGRQTGRCSGFWSCVFRCARACTAPARRFPGCPGGGHDPDRTGRTIARLDELERRIDAYVDELVARKSEAFLRIRRLPELSEQDVLIARYLQCKPWPVIAREMHYEERQVYRIHGRALQHFADDLAQT